MKRLAKGEEPTALIPVIVRIVPVQVQIALGTIPVQVRHVAVAVRVDPARALVICKTSSKPPPIEYSQGCIVFRDFISLMLCTKYLHFWILPKAL